MLLTNECSSRIIFILPIKARQIMILSLWKLLNLYILAGPKPKCFIMLAGPNINIFSQLYYYSEFFLEQKSCSHSCEIWCWYLSISTLIFTHIWHCPNRLLVHYWHIRYRSPTIHISSNVFNPAYYDHFIFIILSFYYSMPSTKRFT